MAARASGGKFYLRIDDTDASRDETVVRPAARPFSATGGLKLLQGNLGRSVIKASAVPEDLHSIEAPARVGQPAQGFGRLRFAMDDEHPLRRPAEAGQPAHQFVAVGMGREHRQLGHFGLHPHPLAVDPGFARALEQFAAAGAGGLEAGEQHGREADQRGHGRQQNLAPEARRMRTLIVEKLTDYRVGEGKIGQSWMIVHARFLKH